MTDRKCIAKDITAQPLSIRYGLLGRMEADCEYFLGYGFRSEKYLWGQNVADHIFYMKSLWNSFSLEKKPEWLSMEKIEAYEREMSKNPGKALQMFKESVSDFTGDFMADGRGKEILTDREKL